MPSTDIVPWCGLWEPFKISLYDHPHVWFGVDNTCTQFRPNWDNTWNQVRIILSLTENTNIYSNLDINPVIYKLKLYTCTCIYIYIYKQRAVEESDFKKRKKWTALRISWNSYEIWRAYVRGYMYMCVLCVVCVCVHWVLCVVCVCVYMCVVCCVYVCVCVYCVLCAVCMCVVCVGVYMSVLCVVCVCGYCVLCAVCMCVCMYCVLCAVCMCVVCVYVCTECCACMCVLCVCVLCCVCMCVVCCVLYACVLCVCVLCVVCCVYVCCVLCVCVYVCCVLCVTLRCFSALRQLDRVRGEGRRSCQLTALLWVLLTGDAREAYNYRKRIQAMGFRNDGHRN
jgi:hypothetical protein